MQSHTEPTDKQKDAAALWLAKRAGASLTATEREELENWLNGDPANRLAFDQMRVLWAGLDEPASRLEAQLASGRPWSRSGCFRFRFPAITAAISCALLAVAWLTAPDFIQDWQADLISGQEIHTVATLPDGSMVHLSADTAIRTDFSNGRRHVALLRGQALFEVEHQDDAPFVVDADSTHIRVVGTRFDVNMQPQQTVVSVADGAVQVRGDHDSQAVLLAPGQAVSVENGTVGHIVATDPELALAWLDGQINVQETTVQTLAAMLDRYTRARIVVLSSLADRKISGTFPATDVKRSLETIASATGATVIHTSPWLSILY